MVGNRRAYAGLLSNLLRVPIGNSLVLAQPGKFRLLLLNPLAAWICEAQTEGWSEPATAQVLAQHFNRPAGEILADVCKTREWLALELQEATGLASPPQEPHNLGWRQWDTHHHRSADLLSPNGYPVFATGVQENPFPSHSPSSRTQRVSIADIAVDLRIDHPDLVAAASAHVGYLDTLSSELCAHTLRLAGSPNIWSLHDDEGWRAGGTGVDGALVELLSALTGIGSDIPSRLLVIHGAGLALPDGRVLLLIAPGGSGKTTLAAALNADGYGLLSDDVVPVTPEGLLVALGMPICVKAGSWPVLAEYRPDLAAAANVQRYGQTVRFLPPRGPHFTAPLAPGLLIFPRYQPGCTPAAEPLPPETVLQRVIEADAVIRDLTQAKLEGIVRWVQSAPAYALTYPDLASGLALVRSLVNPAVAPDV